MKLNLLKTLFCFFEHLQELHRWSPLHVLGLVCHVHRNLAPSPGASRRTCTSISNHVTQSISLSNIETPPFQEKPGPEAVETCQLRSRETFASKDFCQPASKIAVLFVESGGDLEAVLNVFLVELNGIEPLTPCLQSRCSPN